MRRILFVLSILLFMNSLFTLFAESIDPKYIVDSFIDDQGRKIDKIIVPGKPPKDYKAPVAIPTKDAVMLSNVPTFDWSYGCSATSGAMLVGYYDNGNYTNMYAGPQNGGVCPMTNSVWGYMAGECPLSATHQGFDGLGVKGHVDDYWVSYGSEANDPYITGGWTAHTNADCTGDYMGTNQSAYGNTDGGTTFWSSPTPLYDYTGGEPGGKDGCHGLREFIESRGYNIQYHGNYSQYIHGYEGNTTGFTFAQYMAEIDAGRPVFIQVEGHTMLGVGYDSSTNLVYLHDTWDYSTHSMTWGGYYEGMLHYGVAVFMLEPINPPGVATNPNPTDGEGNVSVDTMLSWTNGSNTDEVDVYFSANESYVQNKNSSALISSGTTSTSVDPNPFASLSNETTYYWRIISRNSSKLETDGPVWSFTTAGAGDPPTDLSANVMSGDDVNLVWAAPGGGGSIVELLNDNNTVAGYGSFWSVGDMVAASLDSGVGTYPVTLQNLKVILYDFGGVGSADINLHVFESNSGVPGSEIYSTGSFTNTTFYPNWIDIDISGEGITASSSFFVAVEFTSGNAGSIPSHLTDSQTNIESGKNYYYYGGNWLEHSSLWTYPDQVGYNMLRAVVLTSGSKQIVVSNSTSQDDTRNKQSRATLSGYKIYRNSTLIHTITDPLITSYTDMDLALGDYSYYVTATYTLPNSESVPSNSAEVTIATNLEVTPASIDFMETAIGGWKTETVVMQNIGGGEVIVSSVGLTGDASIQLYDYNEYPITLANNESISVMIAYGPDAVGTNTATLTINDDRAATNVAIAGEGYSHNSWASGTPIFDQSPMGNQGDYSWSMSTSDAAPEYLHAENFWGLTEPITAIEFWGINWYYDSGWVESDVEDPMTFEIKFYTDHATEYQPDGEVLSFSIPLYRTTVDTVTFSSGPVYRYYAELPSEVDLEDGWLSIEGTSVTTPDDPWFLWSQSPIGDLANVSYDNTNSVWEFDEVDLAFALHSETPLAPENVTISTDGTNATVSWTSVSGKYYNIYSDTDPYGTFTAFAGTVTDGSGSFTELLSGSMKFYQVRTSLPTVPRAFQEISLPQKKEIKLIDQKQSFLNNHKEVKRK